MTLFGLLFGCGRVGTGLGTGVRSVEETVETGYQVSERTAREILHTELFQVMDHPVDLATLLTIAIIIAATVLLSRLMQQGVARFLKARGVTDPARISVTQRLLNAALIVVSLSISLETLGLRLSTLFAAGAALAVGLGFALQNIVLDLVSGLIMLVERSVRPQDILEVDGQVVRVENMGLRRSVVRTWDDESLVIPNHRLTQEVIKSLTAGRRTIRIHTHVGVSYASDMDHVAEVLLAAARSVPGRSEHHEPVVLMSGFGDSAVLWDVSIWVRDPWDTLHMRSELNRAIWNGLKVGGIRIPFPQLDLHVQRLPPGPDPS